MELRSRRLVAMHVHSSCLSTSLLILVLLSTASAATLESTDFVKNYLTKYGYLNGQNTDLRHAIKSFQKDFGLSQSGVITAEAVKLMKTPRCGSPDPPNHSVPLAHRRRTKRFTPYLTKWPTTVLKWKVSDPYDVLKPYDQLVVRNTILRALNDWSVAARRALVFKEVDNDEPADVHVFFAYGSHNDSLPFDGKDGVVAHGFYPTNGNLHFDAAERWTLNVPYGINLYQTAVHEIGHLLGLKHSTDKRAVMYPTSRAYDPHYRLAQDDIRGVRYLYTPWAWNYFFSKYIKHFFKKKNGGANVDI